MAKPGPKTDDSGPRAGRLEIRLSPHEQAQIESVRAARGDDYASDAVRALPLIWVERQAVMRAALAEIRGKYSAAEIGLFLDVMNGTHTLSGIHESDGLPDVSTLGQALVANVGDSAEHGPKWEVADVPGLARRLHCEPRAALVAIELWCGWLWSRSDDDYLWTAERAWLCGGSKPPDGGAA